jgi:predicted DNA-binding ribbon-helix-helix protein
MKSSVVKRSIVVVGHKTSVSLEDPFWVHLKSIARAQRMTLSELVASIKDARKQRNLSSAIRLFVLEHFQTEHKRVDVTEAHRTSESAEGTHDSGFDEPR